MMRCLWGGVEQDGGKADGGGYSLTGRTNLTTNYKYTDRLGTINL